MNAVVGVDAGLPSSCEVAIIGAGPIGLMLARLLGIAGLNVIVLERNEGSSNARAPSPITSKRCVSSRRSGCSTLRNPPQHDPGRPTLTSGISL
jgi:choline dehydrogenase-like flavoprotein